MKVFLLSLYSLVIVVSCSSSKYIDDTNASLLLRKENIKYYKEDNYNKNYYSMSTVHSEAVIAVINRIMKRKFDTLAENGGFHPSFYIKSSGKVYMILISEINLYLVVTDGTEKEFLETGELTSTKSNTFLFTVTKDEIILLKNLIELSYSSLNDNK